MDHKDKTGRIEEIGSADMEALGEALARLLERRWRDHQRKLAEQPSADVS